MPEANTVYPEELHVQDYSVALQSTTANPKQPLRAKLDLVAFGVGRYNRIVEHGGDRLDSFSLQALAKLPTNESQGGGILAFRQPSVLHGYQH